MRPTLLLCSLCLFLATSTQAGTLDPADLAAPETVVAPLLDEAALPLGEELLPAELRDLGSRPENRVACVEGTLSYTWEGCCYSSRTKLYAVYECQNGVRRFVGTECRDRILNCIPR
jgi:hypothetical protein